MSEKVECGHTFDGKHHYGARRWGEPGDRGNPRRTVIACVCGKGCPPELLPAVKAGLEATAVEQERQRFPVVGPTSPRFGKKPRYQSR